jgi:hypothetical protein
MLMQLEPSEIRARGIKSLNGLRQEVYKDAGIEFKVV